MTEDVDKSRAMSSFAKLLWPSLYSLSNTLSRQCECLVVTLGVDQCWFAAGTPLQRRSAPGEPPLLVRVQLSGGSCDESVPQPHLGAVPAPAWGHYSLYLGHGHGSTQRHSPQFQGDRRRIWHPRTRTQGRPAFKPPLLTTLNLTTVTLSTTIFLSLK